MKQNLSLPQIDHIRSSAREIVRELGFMHNQLAGARLPPSAVHTIIEVGYGTVTTPGELGRLLHLEKSSISRLLKKLKTDGLLVITQDAADKRVQQLSLSPSGTALLGEIEDFGQGQLLSALQDYPKKDLQIIEDGLSTLSQALLGHDMHQSTPEIQVLAGYQPGLVASVTGLH